MMKIRLTLFVGICFLGMVVVVAGCGGGNIKPIPLQQLRVGEKLPNWHYDENNYNLIDLSHAAVHDDRVIIDGQIEGTIIVGSDGGTITISFGKGKWIAYNGTKFTCVASGGCSVDVLDGGNITKGVIAYYNKY